MACVGPEAPCMTIFCDCDTKLSFKPPQQDMDAVRKVKLGQRWICYACNRSFYDLKRAEPICPRCKADQRESPAFVKPKPKRARGKKAAEPPPAPVEVEEPLAAAEDVDSVDPDLDEPLDDDEPVLGDESELADGGEARLERS